MFVMVERRCSVGIANSRTWFLSSVSCVRELVALKLVGRFTFFMYLRRLAKHRGDTSALAINVILINRIYHCGIACADIRIRVAGRSERCRVLDRDVVRDVGEVVREAGAKVSLKAVSCATACNARPHLRRGRVRS